MRGSYCGFVHRMRTMHQGIMVGIQTVINDDPQLNGACFIHLRT